MKICGTNLIPILITIVSCGVIFMYFNVRLAEVKTAVDKQNRVLTSFITNVQNDIKNGGTIMGANILGTGLNLGANVYSVNSGTGPSGTGPSATGSSATGPSANIGVNHLASVEAIRRVNLNEKIVVSDDDDDDDSSDSDSESNTSSDSEDDDIQDDKSEDIKVINLQDCVSLELITDNFPLDFEQVPKLEEVQEPISVCDSSIWNESELLDESANILKVVDLNTSIDLTKTDVNYEQMKVDDLRKIVLDFTLASKDEVKKLKKPELLTLLKNKPA